VAFRAVNGLNEQIAEYLSQQIIRGELKPGQRIKEAKVAEELGVSRGPIREALHILERKRLVRRLPRRGARVTDVSRSYVDSLYDLLIELYALTARRAAEHRTKQDLGSLRRALKKMRECAERGDVSKYYDAIFEFATAGLVAANSPVLAQIVSDLEPSTRRIQFASLSRRAGELRKTVAFFEDAFRCAEDRDAEGCSRIIRAYALNEKEYALRIWMNQNQGSPSSSKKLYG